MRFGARLARVAYPGMAPPSTWPYGPCMRSDPGSGPPSGDPRSGPPSGDPASPAQSGVVAVLSRGEIHLSFPFDRHLNARVRTLPGRRWDRRRRIWRVPDTAEAREAVRKELGVVPTASTSTESGGPLPEGSSDAPPGRSGGEGLDATTKRVDASTKGGRLEIELGGNGACAGTLPAPARRTWAMRGAFSGTVAGAKIWPALCVSTSSAGSGTAECRARITINW